MLFLILPYIIWCCTLPPDASAGLSPSQRSSASILQNLRIGGVVKSTGYPSPVGGSYGVLGALNIPNSFTALVDQQQCGVPNGNPDFFIPTSSTLRNDGVKANPGERPQKKRTNLRLKFATPRVIGGLDAPDGAGSLRWQVLILLFRLPESIPTAVCGGIIVGSKTIVTSASCASNYSLSTFDTSTVSYSAVTGVTGVQDVTFPNAVTQLNCAESYGLDTAVLHPEYDPWTLDNDIAILTLRDQFNFRTEAGCACKLCLNQQVPQPGDQCIASGWGLEALGTNGFSTPVGPREFVPLKYLSHTIVAPSYDSCGYYENDAGRKTNLDLFLCARSAEGQGACRYDEGGPLFCYDSTTRTQYLAGIISLPDCAGGTGFLGLFTKVSHYLSWIFNTAILGDITIMV